MAQATLIEHPFTSPVAALPAQDTVVLRLCAAARVLLGKTRNSAHLALLQTLCLPVTALWCRMLRFDPTHPDWPDRDRFVVPSATLHPLLQAMLHLSGTYAFSESPLEYGIHPGVETAPGPAGQGIAAAAGMALAEHLLAKRYGRSLVNHRTWVLARDGDLATGVAMEAAQLAGRFGLTQLAVLVSPTPGADRTEFSNSLARFSASGWSIRKVDASQLSAINGALAATMRAKKPTLIACMPSESPQTFHPQPSLSPEEELTGPWSPTARRGATTYRSWLKRLARHRQRTAFERETTNTFPSLLMEDWNRLCRRAMQLTHQASTQQAAITSLHTLSALLPELTVLTATSALPRTSAAAHIQPDWPCNIQEHGMAGMLNGMSLHGGILPCGIASMITVDRMRAALRMAALMRQKIIYLLTDDGLALSHDGASWQPVEQLASLRAMPHLAVFRPANAQEAFACWKAAIRWQSGPAVIMLCPTPPEHSYAVPMQGSAARGGYILHGSSSRHVTLIASGPEVSIALETEQLLRQHGVQAAVVSIPCWEVFSNQPEAYKTTILGTDVLRVGIEAASGFGWERWLGSQGFFVGMDDFGVSAPANAVYERFGITAGAICARVLKHLRASGAIEERFLQASSPTSRRQEREPL